MNMVMRIKKYIDAKKCQMQRGIEVSRQMHDEKQRRKLEKMRTVEPGTVKYGLYHRQNPWDLMKDEYNRRKQERKKKYNS